MEPRTARAAACVAAILGALAAWACSAGAGGTAGTTTGPSGSGAAGSSTGMHGGHGGAGTSTGSSKAGGGGLGLDVDGGLGGGADAGCQGAEPPALDGGIVEPVLDPAFAGLYQVYDLGPVPGAPAGHLGGCVLLQGTTDTLLFGGDSEDPGGGIYSIQVQRNACGHIIGFQGTATLVATTPYVDANLIYGANGVLLYTQWPVNEISQLPPGASMPAVTTDMGALGVDMSVSGLAFVPPNLAAAGGLRTITWSAGNWFHLGLAAAGQLYTISSPVKITTLPNGPGGLAYVPQGSPGFPSQSLIVAEWSQNKVGVYEVDGQGDPMVGTRRDFFSSFTRPWGAYFEPVTGDYLFLTWGPMPDRVYVVQGFALPPPPPPPPT
jgi:hypothetical protein